MAKRQEFKVVLDGIELNEEVSDRIAKAVQQATLAELATVDRRGDLATRLSPGRTLGIWVRALDESQVRELGLEELGE